MSRGVYARTRQSWYGVTATTNLVSFLNSNRVERTESFVQFATNSVVVPGGWIPIPDSHPTLLSILGEGYFLARDGEENRFYVTRDGNLLINSDGNLVTDRGLLVQGYTNAALKQIGDLKLNGEVWPWTASDFAVTGIRIDGDGSLQVILADGTEFNAGQVLLWKVADLSALTRVATRTWALPNPSGPLPLPAVPGSSGLGTLVIGQPQYDFTLARLELSNLPDERPDLRRGLLYPTGAPYDLGIQGPGFFILRDPNSNAIFGTRAGAFFADVAGYLVNYAGLRLQGYTNESLSEIGDLRVLELTNAATVNPWIRPTGKIWEFLGDGTRRVRGQILLRDCSAPGLLIRTNFGLYSVAEESGIWTAMTPPSQANFGWISQRSFELSQCDEAILAVRSRLNFFSQGALFFSDSATDLAISGRGFFTVRNPSTNERYATRLGAFHIDANG
jgi:flagellar hook protein FlgE